MHSALPQAWQDATGYHQAPNVPVERKFARSVPFEKKRALFTDIKTPPPTKTPPLESCTQYWAFAEEAASIVIKVATKTINGNFFIMFLLLSDAFV